MKITKRGIRRNISTSMKASITVEMAYVLPIAILMFLLIIYSVFYYHDKNILIGAAGETAVLGAQTARQEDGNKTGLQNFYRERVKGKLIFLRLTRIEVNKSKKDIEVAVQAGKKRMRVSTIQKAVIPKPEKAIRKKRRLESLMEQENGRE